LKLDGCVLGPRAAGVCSFLGERLSLSTDLRLRCQDLRGLNCSLCFRLGRRRSYPRGLRFGFGLLLYQCSPSGVLLSHRGRSRILDGSFGGTGGGDGPLLCFFGRGLRRISNCSSSGLRLFD
jgi:hypothetical protein